MTDELAVVQTLPAPAEPTYFMPIVQVAQAIERRQMINSFTSGVMVDGIDYGAIPGAGPKKVLLKAGAEKLCSFFGMVPSFVITEGILDFDGSGAGNGEALIYYRIRCDLLRSGTLVGSGDASCSSRESKYRWRDAKPVCPECGGELRKSKDTPQWYCWQKMGGCGATYPLDAIKRSGRIPNPDIADLDNTILKMAEKRALVAATLIATNVSDFFTQDIEDYVEVAPAPRVAQHTPPAGPPDVDFERAPAPIDNGADPWQRWKTPADAHKWAITHGACGTQAEAFALWKTVLDREPFGGKFTLATSSAIYHAYYNAVNETRDRQ